MTQIARYAQFKKVEISSVKGYVKLNLTMTGSVLAETIDAGASSVETNFVVESSADPETIRSILQKRPPGMLGKADDCQAHPLQGHPDA